MSILVRIEKQIIISHFKDWHVKKIFPNILHTFAGSSQISFKTITEWMFLVEKMSVLWNLFIHVNRIWNNPSSGSELDCLGLLVDKRTRLFISANSCLILPMIWDQFLGIEQQCGILQYSTHVQILWLYTHTHFIR